MRKCLYCYKELTAGETDFHKSCSQRFFGTTTAPSLGYTHNEMEKLAEQVIRSQTTLTGVQAKLSLHLTEHEGTKRLTIVGLWGDYIFKPQTDIYPQLPEVEDVTMHLAQLLKIPTAKHTLIRLQDGELGYLTRRFDRTEKGGKLAMEDFCQLTERKTEDKYKSSYEQIAKTIIKYSSIPQLDITNLFELLLFCFITGNNDMHLKNFSLYKPQHQNKLTPAYDLVNAAIVNPKDKEEFALTLNGKKANIKYNDFLLFALKFGLTEKYVNQTINTFKRQLPLLHETINQSFLSDDLKTAYHQLIEERFSRLLETE